MGPWHLTAKRTFDWWDRLCLLIGVPLYVRFTSPDGECHAACEIQTTVHWPRDNGMKVREKPAATRIITRGDAVNVDDLADAVCRRLMERLRAASVPVAVPAPPRRVPVPPFDVTHP
jgi:hypothetical protein